MEEDDTPPLMILRFSYADRIENLRPQDTIYVHGISFPQNKKAYEIRFTGSAILAEVAAIEDNPLTGSVITTLIPEDAQSGPFVVSIGEITWISPYDVDIQ